MRLGIIVAAGVVWLASSAACIGESPVKPGDSRNDDSDAATPNTSSSSSTSSASSSGASSGELPDASGTCPVGFGNCDDDPEATCETDLRTTPAHCGACNRACGGTSSCQASECATEVLASARPQPFGLALSPTRAVWIEPAAVKGCRLADCANVEPPTLHDLETDAGFSPFYSARQIAIDGGNFYFSRCPFGGANPQDCGVARCAIEGCKSEGAPYLNASPSDRRARLLVGGPGAIYTFSSVIAGGLNRTNLGTGVIGYPSYQYVDYFQGLYVDEQIALYVDDNASVANPDGGLYRCPAAGCTAEVPRRRLLPPPVKHLAVASGTAFVSSGPASGSSLVSCNVEGCTGTEQVLATLQAYVADIAADSTAVYWITTGTPDPEANTAAIGTLMRCALPVCAGGPQKIAENLINPVSVRLDAEYVYWLTRGASATPSGTLSRKRR